MSRSDFGDVTPTREHNPVPSDDVRHGLNATTTGYDDSKYITCWNCKQKCQLQRDARSSEGSRTGDGIRRPDTLLTVAVALLDTTITVASTTGFADSGYIYIYDAASVRSTGTQMDKVAYTGLTGTTFTGCTEISRTHEIDDVVRGELTVGMGCPFCGCLVYSG